MAVTEEQVPGTAGMPESPARGILAAKVAMLTVAAGSVQEVVVVVVITEAEALVVRHIYFAAPTGREGAEEEAATPMLLLLMQFVHPDLNRGTDKSRLLKLFAQELPTTCK